MDHEVKDKKQFGNTKIQSMDSRIYISFPTNKVIQAIINYKASSAITIIENAFTLPT